MKAFIESAQRRATTAHNVVQQYVNASVLFNWMFWPLGFGLLGILTYGAEKLFLGFVIGDNGDGFPIFLLEVTIEVILLQSVMLVIFPYIRNMRMGYGVGLSWYVSVSFAFWRTQRDVMPAAYNKMLEKRLNEAQQDYIFEFYG